MNEIYRIPPVLSYDNVLYLSKEYFSKLLPEHSPEIQNTGLPYCTFKIGTLGIRYIRYDDIRQFDITATKNELTSISIDYSSLPDNDPHFVSLKILLLSAYVNFKKYIVYYTGFGLLVDQIHKYAKTHALLETSFKLLHSKECTIKDLYYILKSDEFTDTSFKISSMKYFYNFLKRAESHKGRLETFIRHGLIGQPSNRERVNKKVEKLIVYFARHTNKVSARYIRHNVNIILLMTPKINGGKTISIQTVQRVLNQPEVRNLIRLNNSEDVQTLDRLLPYLLLQNAENSCDRFEMDFTKLQIAAKDDKNNITYFVICYVIDTYSKKIISYGIGKSENSVLALKVFEQAVLTIGNRLPAEIVIDKSSAFKGSFKRIKKYTESLGMIWTVSSNPRRKAKLERLISTVQSVFLNPVFGYIGEGIKSKRKKARIGGEAVVILHDPEYVRNKQKLDYLMNQIVSDYNNTEIKENHPSPNTLYRGSKRKNAIRLLHWQPPFMFWAKHTIKVDSSVAIIVHKGIKRGYVTYDKELCLRTNGQCIDFFILPSSDKIAYAFEENSSNYLGQYELHHRVSCAKINQTARDKRLFKAHFLKRQTLRNNLLDEMKSIDQDIKNDLGSLPDELIHHRTSTKESIHQAEFRKALGIENKSVKSVDVYDVAKRFKSEKVNNDYDMSMISSDYLNIRGSGKRLI